MSDAFWGAFCPVAAAIVSAVGYWWLKHRREGHSMSRADLDGANTAWRELFNEAKAERSAMAQRIDKVEARAEACEAQHAECERQHNALKRDFEHLKTKVHFVDEKVVKLEDTVRPIS